MKKMSFLFMVLSINLLILQGCKQNAENSDGTISANGETDDDADFDPSEVFIGRRREQRFADYDLLLKWRKIGYQNANGRRGRQANEYDF